MFPSKLTIPATVGVIKFGTNAVSFVGSKLADLYKSNKRVLEEKAKANPVSR